MKKLLICTIFAFTVFPILLNGMDPSTSSSSRGAVITYSGFLGFRKPTVSDESLRRCLIPATDAKSGPTLDLSRLELDGPIFQKIVGTVSSFIQKNNVTHLNLENNKFDYVPLELIKLMVSAQSLETASLKGNFNRSKGAGDAIMTVLPDVLKALHELVQQMATANPTDVEQGMNKMKIIYLDENLAPLYIPVSPQFQKTAPSKLKPLLVSGLTFITGIVATQGVNLLSMYLKGWLGNEQNSDCACP